MERIARLGQIAATPLIALLLLVLVPGTAYAAQVSVATNDDSLETGDTFTAYVNVSPGTDKVYGAQCDFNFDSSKLDVVSYSSGEFLTSDGSSTITARDDLDEATGKLEYGETRVDTDTGVSSSGTLLEVELKVTQKSGAGPTGLTLSDVLLSDASADEITGVSTSDDSVTITTPPSMSSVVENAPGVKKSGNGYIVHSGYSYLNVTFSSNDYDSLTTTVNFGDGTSSDYAGNVSGETVGHTYTEGKKKSYKVSLTAEDDHGAKGKSSYIVTVYAPGDSNGDDEVNILDAVRMANSWGSAHGTSGYDPLADLNADGDIDVFDAGVIGQNWS